MSVNTEKRLGEPVRLGAGATGAAAAVLSVTSVASEDQLDFSGFWAKPPGRATTAK